VERADIGELGHVAEIVAEGRELLVSSVGLVEDDKEAVVVTAFAVLVV
jgi:hypothetical protein